MLVRAGWACVACDRGRSKTDNLPAQRLILIRHSDLVTVFDSVNRYFEKRERLT